jgi:thioredoxin reductase (NADPH)
MFPVLEAVDIGRLHRYGQPRSFRNGQRLVSEGDVAASMYVILKGEVVATQHGDFAGAIHCYARSWDVHWRIGAAVGSPRARGYSRQDPVETLAIPSQRIAI